MARTQDIEVRITRHTLSIGGQHYQLRNIARVQRIDLVPKRVRNTLRVAGRVVAALLVLAVLNLIVSAETGVGVPPELETLNEIALAAVLVVGLVAMLRKLFARRWYVLLLETSGTAVGVLQSQDWRVIDELVLNIAKAIDEPPDTPYVLHVGDVVMRDQYKQTGDHNTIKTLLSE